MTKTFAVILTSFLLSQWSLTNLMVEDTETPTPPRTYAEPMIRIGELQQLLDFERLAVGSNLARATVEEYKKRFLIPKYLLPNATSAPQVKAAYLKFLNDERNKTAVEIRNKIQNHGYTLTTYTEMCTVIFVSTSKTIHFCYEAYVKAQTYEVYLWTIGNFRTLRSNQMKVLAITSEFTKFSIPNFFDV